MEQWGLGTKEFLIQVPKEHDLHVLSHAFASRGSSVLWNSGAGYQRIPGIQLLEENDLHGLAAESVANFAALAQVGVSTQFAGP